MKRFRRVLIGTALSLCLLCLCAIGMINKAFAAPVSYYCMPGASCGYGSWQGVCDTSWFMCECAFYIGDREETAQCMVS